MRKKIQVQFGAMPAFALVILILFAIFSVASVALTGCSDNKPTSAAQELPDIEGAVVPETVEEGTPIDIEVWGRTPDENWTLTGFNVTGGSGEIVTVTPEGHRTGMMTGHRGMFRGTATLPAPGSGAHTIRIAGGGGPMDFPMHVFARNALVNLMVHGPGGSGHEQLVIGADGSALAFRMGDGPAVRVQLSAAAVDSVRGFFRDAGFLDLADRYIGDRPIDDLLYEVSYRPDAGQGKRVVAEDHLAPESLKRLVEDLRGMLERILGNGSTAAVVASIEVDPASGDRGTPRTITLSLQNRSAAQVTLHFPTAQIYDVAIMEMQGMMGDMGHGGMGGMGAGGNMGGANDYSDSRHMIWNWAYGRDFSQAPTDLTLQAGEVDTFRVVWPGTTNQDAVADTGLYRVAAMILSRPMIPTRSGELVVGETPAPPGPLLLTCTVHPQSGPSSMEREMRLTLENPTDQPVTIHFPNGQLYDFSVFDPMRMRPGPMWEWSHGRSFDPDPVDRTIPAHDRIEFVEHWDCRDSGGMGAHAGWYGVDGFLNATGLPAVDRVRVEVTRQ